MSTTPNCRLVVSDESGTTEILGEYARTEEDAVAYWREEDGTLGWAPEDCVRVVPGHRPRIGVPAVIVSPETEGVRRIARHAAELVARCPHTTYDEVVALVAYAYAEGNRDGYAEAAEAADAILAPLREAVQS